MVLLQKLLQNRRTGLQVLAPFVTLPVKPVENPAYVSMVRVLANPETFDEKPVSLVGFLKIGPEWTGLYLNAEDYQHGILENALSVELTDQIRKDREKLDMNYVHILGVFDSKHLGQGPFPSGEITRVAKCDLWSELKYPRAQRYQDLWNKKPK